MKLHNNNASVFVPDGLPVNQAIERITHLSIGAHQDDSEIMAFHGVLECFNRVDCWYGVVTCTDGAGSPRTGEYDSYSDEDIAKIRRREQEKAAMIGDYGILIQLNYKSSEVKSTARQALKSDLINILKASNPEVVYIHNPLDKHDTHLAVSFAAIAALRDLPPREKPRQVLGCEVWRGLDWVNDNDKVALDVSAHENLAMALVGVYDSQIAGGKRYDLATLGRRRANASYFETHETDMSEQLWFALDLTPVVLNLSLNVEHYVLSYIDRFKKNVEEKIKKFIL